jgi:hypothetical protein
MEPYRNSNKPTPTPLVEFGSDIFLAFAQPGLQITRNDQGIDLLRFGKLLSSGVILTVISLVAQAINPATVNALFWFALISFGFGIFRLFRRWRDFDNAIPHHSRYIGTSKFQVKWLPEALLKNRRAARYLEPPAWIFLSFIVLHFSRALGLYLFGVGVSIYTVERNFREEERNRVINMVNGKIIADRMAEDFEKFERPPISKETQPSFQVATGLSPDLQQSINNRRKASQPKSKGKIQ